MRNVFTSKDCGSAARAKELALAHERRLREAGYQVVRAESLDNGVAIHVIEYERPTGGNGSG